MVLDTDTYNEIDDQFAVTYGLLSPERLSVEALYARRSTTTARTGRRTACSAATTSWGGWSIGWAARRCRSSGIEAVARGRGDARSERRRRGPRTPGGLGEEPLYVVAIGA
jgi:hypothetical protein